MRVPGKDEGDALLRLALSQPARALSRAAAVLESEGTDPCLASAALQARGIVLRDRGESTEAVEQLRAALAMAQRCGTVERISDVRASLGAALVMHGRTQAGLAQLERAAAGVHGVARATVLMRRAYVLGFLGRPDPALDDLRVALAGFRRAGDVVWEARTLNNRASVLIALGEITRAERDVRRAEEMFAGAGQALEAVHALHNRAMLAQLRGDLPEAFTLYDRAEVAYGALGTRPAELVVDRCQAFLAAGLTSAAVELTTQVLGAEPLQPRHRAEVELAAATAALADGDPVQARTAAQHARAAFVRQGRDYWVDRCDLVAAQARFQSGHPVRLPALRRVTEALVRTRAEEAALALLLSGRLAAARGEDDRGELAAAARYRRSPTPQIRATAWLALALERDLAGDRSGVLRAARQGLDTLAAYRDSLGSVQLRALATRHTAELTALALRHVLASGDARALLTWSERARAAALARPAVRPPDDPALAGQLAAMRAVARSLDAARDRGTPTAELTARLAHLEAAIDQRQRHARAPAVHHPPAAEGPGSGERGPVRRAGGRLRDFDPEGSPSSRSGLVALREALGERVLVEVVDVGDELHAVLVRGRRVRAIRIGSASAAHAAVQRARFALRQAARGRPVDLAGAGQQLESALLGGVARMLGDAPVVVVPPARLHHAPWTLCPSLAVLPVTSSPSAGRWLGAHRATLRGGGATGRGPGRGDGGTLVLGRGGEVVGRAPVLGGGGEVGEGASVLGGGGEVGEGGPVPGRGGEVEGTGHSQGRGGEVGGVTPPRGLAAADSTVGIPAAERPQIALIAGPGLAGADDEVLALAASHPAATVLRGAEATVSATLAALGDAAVVHVAAHGRHRSDNPMFSSLQLADGPLTVHDLVGLRRPPGRIVLSACDSGVMAAIGADALLGLAEALLAQGAAGVVCAVSEVNDAATRPVMEQVHAALAGGLSPADALLQARHAARGETLAEATAASFTSLGA